MRLVLSSLVEKAALMGALREQVLKVMARDG